MVNAVEIRNIYKSFFSLTVVITQSKVNHVSWKTSKF